MKEAQRRRLEEVIRDRLQEKTDWLKPVLSSIYDIPDRLYDYDPNMFIVFNTRKQWYEVHNLANKGDTFAISVPFKRLDSRVLEAVRRSDLRVRGMEIFREIDEHNERLAQSKERQRRDTNRAIAEEVRPYFQKLAWEGV